MRFMAETFIGLRLELLVIRHYSSIPNKRPGVAYFFFEKNPGGDALIRVGSLIFFPKKFRGVAYFGGVADFFGLLWHIF